MGFREAFLAEHNMLSRKFFNSKENDSLKFLTPNSRIVCMSQTFFCHYEWDTTVLKPGTGRSFFRARFQLDTYMEGTPVTPDDKVG